MHASSCLLSFKMFSSRDCLWMVSSAISCSFSLINSANLDYTFSFSSDLGVSSLKAILMGLNWVLSGSSDVIKSWLSLPFQLLSISSSVYFIASFMSSMSLSNFSYSLIILSPIFDFWEIDAEFALTVSSALSKLFSSSFARLSFLSSWHFFKN